jgi:hypothetical protein
MKDPAKAAIIRAVRIGRRIQTGFFRYWNPFRPGFPDRKIKTSWRIPKGQRIEQYNLPNRKVRRRIPIQEIRRTVPPAKTELIKAGNSCRDTSTCLIGAKTMVPAIRTARKRINTPVPAMILRIRRGWRPGLTPVI